MKLSQISVKDCVPFKGNPFQIRNDGLMEMLIDSIRQSGVLVPIAVRPTEGNRYEITADTKESTRAGNSESKPFRRLLPRLTGTAR